MTQFVLASASPARLAVLRAAGVEPRVQISDVDEDALLAELGAVEPADVVMALARAKAHSVAERLGAPAAAVIIGCDSMLHIDGRLVGKPHTVEVARARWSAMAGRSAELLTGHCVLRPGHGAATGTQATTVHFAAPDPEELDAYLATGEPLEVAGAFTLDGLGGWFVEGVDGDPSSVVGISLPLVRRLLRELELRVTDFWR